MDFGSILDSFLIVFGVGFGGRRHGQNIHATPFIFRTNFHDFLSSSLQENLENPLEIWGDSEHEHFTFTRYDDLKRYRKIIREHLEK